MTVELITEDRQLPLFGNVLDHPMFSDIAPHVLRKGDNRRFFRGDRSTAQMLALADLVPDQLEFDRMLNRPWEDAGCAEECNATIEPNEGINDGIL